MKSKKWNIILLIALTIVTIAVIFTQISLKEVFSILKSSDIKYILVGFLFMIIFWLLESIMMYIMLRKTNKNIHLWTAIKSTIIGQFYSLITPFASGGQPAQIYVMKKDQIPISTGSAVLVGKFLIFQISVTLYALTLSIFRLKHLLFTQSAVTFLALASLAINLIGLTVIIFMAFNPKALKKIIHTIIYFLHKIKLVKRLDHHLDKTDHFIIEYQDTIHLLKNDIFMTIQLFVITIFQLTFYFSITFMIYKSLGLNTSTFIDIISLQALLYMAVCFIPIPGTIGASETGFVLLFGSIFTGHFAAVAMILWRLISYYFGLAFCGIFSLVSHFIDAQLNPSDHMAPS